MVWTFLISVASLWILLNYVLKKHYGFLNSVLVFSWVIGGIWLFFYAVEEEYSAPIWILIIIFFGITFFWFDTQRGMWEGYTAEDWEKHDNNAIKFGLKKCPNCFKKLPSYLTTKCPHCTADI